MYKIGGEYLTVGGQSAVCTYKGFNSKGVIKYLFVHRCRSEDLNYDTAFWHYENGQVQEHIKTSLDIFCEDQNAQSN